MLTNAGKTFMKERIQRYVEHNYGCPMRQGGEECNCGLLDVIAALTVPEPEVTGEVETPPHWKFDRTIQDVIAEQGFAVSHPNLAGEVEAPEAAEIICPLCHGDKWAITCHVCNGAGVVPSVETPEAVVEAMLQAENEWLSEPSDESYTADEWDAFRARHMLDAAKPHLVAQVRVGWWHWFDGDLTKRGAFRYDHPGHGISVPVYRPAMPGGEHA
jgi:hypothetical protein